MLSNEPFLVNTPGLSILTPMELVFDKPSSIVIRSPAAAAIYTLLSTAPFLLSVILTEPLMVSCPYSSMNRPPAKVSLRLLVISASPHTVTESLVCTPPPYVAEFCSIFPDDITNLPFLQHTPPPLDPKSLALFFAIKPPCILKVPSTYTPPPYL